MLDEIGVLTSYHWVSASTVGSGLVARLAEDGIVLLPAVLAALWFLPRRGTAERRQILVACGVSLAVSLVLVGVLSLLFDRARPFVALGIPPVGEILQDVTISGIFRKIGGPPGCGYGFIVRDQGPGPRDGVNQAGRYYVLEVDDKGEVGIWRRDGDRWVDLLPWQRADAVHTGNATNDVTVRASGERLSLSVNGTEVAARNDKNLTVGNVGIFVGGDGNQVALEQLTVKTP